MTPSQLDVETDRLVSSASRAPLEPMDPALKSVQPGGGVIVRLELAWGRWRRWYLQTFRHGYVQKMAALRQGDLAGCPHDVLDPRDLKFYRNVCDCHWPAESDPFAWRDRLPLARAGLAEVLLLGGGSFALTAVLAFVYWPAAVVPAALGLFVLWFFRNPQREIPQGPGEIVSPADGKVVTIDELDHDEFIGGPAVLIGIFLSVFNVHVNRTPAAVRVIGLTYRRGKYLNALKAASARENEQLAVRLEETEAPYRRYIVRQIAGAIARRIVCWLKPGDELSRGELFGMIKFGSRTELVLPREAGLEITVKVGQHVRGGASILARYRPGTHKE